MSDHTGTDAPIRRPQTCEQKHDATIATLNDRINDLQAAAGYVDNATEQLVRDLATLRARVAALEAHIITLEALHTYHIPAGASNAPDDPGYIHSPGYPQDDADAQPETLTPGDYVLATKYTDGDPQDQWCVGFYDRIEGDRHYVVDADGQQFRANGFRRAARISQETGAWILRQRTWIEKSGESVWHFSGIDIATDAQTEREHSSAALTPDAVRP
jgi:hypothetical protein